MKKIIYILTSIIFACTSCTGELGLDEGHKKDGFTLTIYNAPLTKAIDNTGEAYERELRTLDIFFYPKGETDQPCVFYHHEDLTNTFGQTEVNIYVVEDAIRKIFPTQNLCDIFIIANLPESVKPADVVFAAESKDTRLDRLAEYVLQNGDKANPNFVAEYDAINKPFVMAGLGVGQRDSKKNASGTISLVRASSKITLSVAIPEYLDVEVTTTTSTGSTTETVRMVPTFEDKPMAETMNVSFRNGTYKGYLSKEADEAVDTFYFSSPKQTFTYSETLKPIKYKNPDKATQDSIPSRRVYTCNVPFYTYARQWVKGAADAPYMTFEMKWGADRGDGSVPMYDTYYYQILINGADRTFEPNHWYDMFVNVGVIGSTIEIKPTVIDHLSFFVLDWSDTISGVDHPNEDVVFENYTYFNVLTKRLELDNVTSGVIEYKASHKINWRLDTSERPVEGVANLSTDFGAFSINCGGNAPATQKVTGYTLTDDGDGSLKYEYTIPTNVYSPVYIYLTLWLELDGNGVMSDAESAYSESVMIVQYPPIYIIPELSAEKSVYVNGQRATAENDNVITIGGRYDLGGAPGVGNRYMHTINVSSFSESNKFNFFGERVSYIIGDPRVRVSDINLNDDGYNMAANNAWVQDQSGRRLQYYYPTDNKGEIYRVIAPKFKISSRMGGYSAGDREGVAMRCASYQENGYPAGRWRVPTTAEIAFIVYLDSQDAIPELFYNNDYFSSTHLVEGQSEAVIKNIDNSDHSVRCVYDEWYWGSQQDALVNTSRNPSQGDYYYYTWGDEPITW